MHKNFDPASNGANERPVYMQLRDDFLERIRKGEWSPRRALPNEVELANASRVSVGTIRKVMDELSILGLVTRQQGRGTFVNDATIASCGLFDPIRNADGSTIQWDPTRCLEVSTTGLTSQEAMRLGRAQSFGDALRFVWLHSKNSRAFALQRSVVPLDTGIDAERARHTSGLGEVFRQAGVLVIRSEDQLTMAIPDQDVADRLNVPGDRPLQHVARRYFDAREKIVGLCSSWLVMKDEQYVCSQTLGR